MKKMKKALLGTALAGTLVIGAGAGTYSWFNADYKVSGEITNHTLSINKSLSATETLSFGKLAPSQTKSDTFSFRNTGSMDQILRAGLNFQLKDKDGNAISAPSKDKYIVTATVKFKRGTQEWNFGPVSGNAQAIDQYLAGNTWFPDDSGAENPVFKPGDKVEVKLDVKLHESAGNEYQGLKLYGELEIDARQTDANSEFNSN
ncbi:MULTISPECIES: CalY family protein [Cytobacillus]|uniref:CalY family protein n=1 Tax=Cytobacillus TaxID=2675230 RepID=UPI00203B9E8D|nr:CalY family protein [Cytobacillus firmus]MCM3707661.1 CalY family protein [Cytobacillus firmus]